MCGDKLRIYTILYPLFIPWVGINCARQTLCNEKETLKKPYTDPYGQRDIVGLRREVPALYNRLCLCPVKSSFPAGHRPLSIPSRGL